MIKLIKESEKSEQQEKNDYTYKLVNDNQPLGYGTINGDKENQIFIFVDKNQRGNGYGKVLFSKMLEETKKLGYNEVKIAFSKENIPMMKIATENNGKETFSDEDSIKYIFSLN